MKYCFAICIAVLLLFPGSGFAKKRQIQPGDTVEVAVQLKKGEKLVACLDGQGGKTRLIGGVLYFISWRDVFRKKKKRYASDPSQRNKRQRNNARALMKAGDAACSALQGDDPTPSPSESPTPTPTPSGDSYFESNGDVTPLGKAEFEIPSTINANAFVGEQVYQLNCTGCHEKRARPTMPLLRLAISQAPMYYTEVAMSDEDLADLTAYLNIYRTP